MNPTDILLSITIVGIYTIIYVYLKSKYDDNKTIIKLFVIGFIYATAITGILYYLIKYSIAFLESPSLLCIIYIKLIKFIKI